MGHPGGSLFGFDRFSVVGFKRGAHAGFGFFRRLSALALRCDFGLQRRHFLAPLRQLRGEMRRVRRLALREYESSSGSCQRDDEKDDVQRIECHARL